LTFSLKGGLIPCFFAQNDFRAECPALGHSAQNSRKKQMGIQYFARLNLGNEKNAYATL
jgi:hypothetical protein